MRTSVKFTNVGLDEVDSKIIFRCRLSNCSLEHIKVDDYQRKALFGTSADELEAAVEARANLPAITLNVRGTNYTARGDDHFVTDDVFVVDGLQRLTAARKVRDRGGDPHLGAEVHFGLTKDQERKLFQDLNIKRVKVSSNITIRNMAPDFPVVAALLTVNSDSDHPLFRRITCDQRAATGEIISLNTLVKVTGALLSHLGPTRTSKTDELIPKLQDVMTAITKRVFMENVRGYADLIEACWGIKTITYKEGATWMKYSFLRCLAELLSRYHTHSNLWQGNRLKVDLKVQRKIASFPVNDNEVIRLASSGGKAKDHLLILMTEHLQSGRGTRVLRGRPEATRGES